MANTNRGKPIIPKHRETVWRIDPRPSFEFSCDDMIDVLRELKGTLPAVSDTIASDLSEIAGRYVEASCQKIDASQITLTSRAADNLVKAAETLRVGLNNTDELFRADVSLLLGSDFSGVSGPDRVIRLMMDMKLLPRALRAAATAQSKSKKVNDCSTLVVAVSSLVALYETATGRNFTHSAVEYQRPDSEAGKFIVAVFAKIHGGKSLEHCPPRKTYWDSGKRDRTQQGTGARP